MSPGFMSATDFFRETRNYFRYLLDTYGFVVAAERTPGHADIAEVVLNAPTWCVVVYREHAYVNIMVGPIQPDTRRLYDLGHVIAFLDRSSEAEAMWFGCQVDIFADYSRLMHTQLEWWSKTLREYCDRLANLFSEQVYPTAQPELEAWREQVEMAIRRNLSNRSAVE